MDGMQDFLSKIGEGLRTLAGSIEALSKQVEAYAKKEEPAAKPTAAKPKKAKARKAKTVKKPKAAVKKAEPAKKTAAEKKEKAPAEKPKKKTASVVVLEIIKGSDSGVSAAALKEETGFNDKKIANCIYRLKKQGAIQSTKRGIYTSV